MMFPETPTVDHRAPLGIAEFDQHPRHRVGAALKDAHAIIQEFEVLDVLLIDAEILAQRQIERVDGAVALGGRNQGLFADADLDDRLRGRIERAGGIELALDADVETLDVEKFGHAAQNAARQQFEGRVGRLVGEALRLAILDLVEQPGEPGIVGARPRFPFA